MTLTLRDYQTECVDAVEREWREGHNRTAAVLPTGAGKTVAFGEVIRRFRAREPRRRALVIAHRRELIEQAAGKIRDVAPDLGVGIAMAERNQVAAPVVVGSVQTLGGARGERRRRMIRDVGLVVVDECHHTTAQTYLDVLDHFGCMERGGTPTLGVTATLSRGDEASLGDIWTSVAYQRDIAWMIQRGYLVRPRGIHVEVADLDLSRVRKSAGDYRDGDLGKAIESSLAPELIAKAYLEHATLPDGRLRPAIVFAPLVSTAQIIGEALTALGVRVGHVNGAQAVSERRSVLDGLRNGTLDIVTNCMVLTEGTDIPPVSCVIIARPTLHGGLFVQMAGRGLRLFPGKDDCLILDVVGATQRHSLIAAVELFGEEVVRAEIDPDAEESELEDEQPVDVDEAFGTLPEQRYAAGPMVAHEVDLFHGSGSAWLRTYGGIWFLPAGERLIALLPSRTERGHWDVVAMHKYRQGTGRWVATGIGDQGYAMAHAEGDVLPGELMTADRKRAWRRTKPSDAQRAYAQRLGVVVTDDMSKGEVSNLLCVTEASWRIDPPLRAWYR